MFSNNASYSAAPSQVERQLYIVLKEAEASIELLNAVSRDSSQDVAAVAYLAANTIQRLKAALTGQQATPTQAGQDPGALTAQQPSRRRRGRRA